MDVDKFIAITKQFCTLFPLYDSLTMEEGQITKH
jgi:hypothetical protein